MSLTIKFKSGPPESNQTRASDPSDVRRIQLLDQYSKTRSLSELLAEPLHPEDQIIQSMPDASPTKWHLAHTTWFFETFILLKYAGNYSAHDPAYDFLFNSYYYTHGQMHARPKRGLLSRPTSGQVANYRAAVDEAMFLLLETASQEQFEEIAPVLEIGIHHEQQHQELLLTDIKHALHSNPLQPTAYARPNLREAAKSGPIEWHSFEGGIGEIGHDGHGFSYDNETPRHQRLIHGFALANRPITNGEYLEFIEDGGYEAVSLWLSEGWSWLQENKITHPLYWHSLDGEWREYTLAGAGPLDPAKPLSHISLYEASAYAAWAGKRLPFEEEWEYAAQCVPVEGLFLDHPQADGTPYSGRSYPVPAPEPFSIACEEDRLTALFGTVWEWTMSAYSPYPGFKPLEGTLGEYNGKFMCNQTVLRGGSAFTPQGHIRASYRNFFPPSARWQLSGIRLAQDLN